MTSTPPDEPTRWMPPPGAGDEPTRVIPAPPAAAPPPPPVPPVRPAYGGPPPGEPPSNPNRTIAAVAIGLAVVLLILIGLLIAARHKSKGSAPTTTTSTPSSLAATTTTAVPTTTTAVPTTTTPPTTVPPTTASQAAPAGNRPATSAESRQILADVDDSHPGYQVTTLRIANSDNSWAALKYDGGPTQQPFEEVRHLSGGHWGAVSTGTAQVACDPSIPSQVQRDFADILGGC